MKTLTTIRIETEILEKAKELGINISKATENSLKILITSMNNGYSQIPLQNKRESMKTEGCHKWTGGDLNPRPPECKSDRQSNINLPSQINWDGFSDWLRKDKNVNYARDLRNYAKRYVHCLETGDLSELKLMNAPKRRMVLASLSNLAKYLGIYDMWVQLIRKYGVQWISMGVRDKRIIDRLTKAENPDVVYDWIKQLKKMRPELTDFLELMAITGMRLTEALASYNLMIKLSKEGKLSDYYDSDKEILQHYKFNEIFLRKGKKAFISFVPKHLISRISENDPISSRHALRRRGEKTRYGDIREAHASILTKYLSQPEIDFLHGRVGTSVFMQNYFNPAMISDLKTRVFKAIAEIQEKIALP